MSIAKENIDKMVVFLSLPADPLFHSPVVPVQGAAMLLFLPRLVCSCLGHLGLFPGRFIIRCVFSFPPCPADFAALLFHALNLLSSPSSPSSIGVVVLVLLLLPLILSLGAPA